MAEVFGYVRFSFFGRNDTKIARRIADEQERFDILFNPERMEERFYFFEKITLPSIRAQTDQDFRILVLASSVMPDVYKHRLNKAVAGIGQIEVIYSDAGHIHDALTPWIKTATADIDSKTVHFRLDDDDAICAQMVAMLKRDAKRSRAGELLTYPRGFFLTVADGKAYLLRKFEPYIAIAWAIVNEPGQLRNPFQGKHGSQFKHVPSKMDPRPFAYIHVAHESSDTKAAQARKLHKALEYDPQHNTDRSREQVGKIIRNTFPGFSLEGLERIILSAPNAQKPTLVDTE